jgi:hypothetical protein
MEYLYTILIFGEATVMREQIADTTVFILCAFGEITGDFIFPNRPDYISERCQWGLMQLPAIWNTTLYTTDLAQTIRSSANITFTHTSAKGDGVYQGW